MEIIALKKVQRWYLQENNGTRTKDPNVYGPRTCLSLCDQRSTILCRTTIDFVSKVDRISQSACNVFAQISHPLKGMTAEVTAGQLYQVPNNCNFVKK
jgi:hypothetical protein